MKTLALILLLLTPVIAQTRAELDSKYGPLEGNRYKIRPGVAAEVEFAENGKLTAFRIVPDDLKDKNALLNAKDFWEIIREIAPGRLCHRSESLNKTDAACPPRKGCQGVQETWPRATIFTVWFKNSPVYALVTLNNSPVPPPGDMKLLPGYENVPGCGIDTLAGHIKKVGGVEIHYDIGLMAGSFASRYAAPNAAQWTRTEEANGESVLVVLRWDNYIVATFQKNDANFTAKVGSQADIDDFLKMVLTYHPRK